VRWEGDAARRAALVRQQGCVLAQIVAEIQGPDLAVGNMGWLQVVMAMMICLGLSHADDADLIDS
jgi:hypothetical protein